MLNNISLPNEQWKKHSNFDNVVIQMGLQHIKTLNNV